MHRTQWLNSQIILDFNNAENNNRVLVKKSLWLFI